MPLLQKDKKSSINDNINNETDKELVKKICEGDDLALKEIMNRYKYKLHPFIISYVKDEDLAYDILQETFIKLFLKANTFNPSYNFSTWLYQIAINLCRDYARKNKIRQFISLDKNIDNEGNNNSYIDILSDSSEDIEKTANMRQEVNILSAEINKLPHKLKTALILYTIENHSQEKCAEILDVTTKTIETIIYRARKILIERTNIDK